MILGSLAKQPISCLTTQSGVIERVDTFKLLGVTVSSDGKHTKTPFVQKLLHGSVT